MAPTKVLTIGHSTHDISTFIDLLRQNGITAVADVRSVPVSRFSPQFCRNALNRSLKDAGVKYVFMGDQLGARTKDTNCYVDGRVQYSRVAQSREFNRGIERLMKGMETEHIAIMCAEQEPLDCHRTILVAKVLAERGVRIDHIHGDGYVERHVTAMQRLMAKFGLDKADLFHTQAELLDEALTRQEQRIAYINEDLRVGGALEE